MFHHHFIQNTCGKASIVLANLVEKLIIIIADVLASREMLEELGKEQDYDIGISEVEWSDHNFRLCE